MTGTGCARWWEAGGEVEGGAKVSSEGGEPGPGVVDAGDVFGWSDGARMVAKRKGGPSERGPSGETPLRTLNTPLPFFHTPFRGPTTPREGNPPQEIFRRPPANGSDKNRPMA